MIRGLLTIAAALVAFSAPTAAQDPTTRFADQLTAAVPKLAFLRLHDPVAFARIIAIYEEGAEAGKSVDELVGSARAAFVREQATRLAIAPDPVVLHSLDSTVAVARDLHGRSPERCAALFGGGNAGDIKPFLSSATVASEDAGFEELYTAPSGPVTPAATAGEEEEFIHDALAAQATTAAEPIKAYLERAMASPTAFCAMQLELLQRLRAAPNAAALFRRRLAAKE